MVSSRSASNTLNLSGKIQCFRISSQPVQQLPESFPPAQEIPLKLNEYLLSRSTNTPLPTAPTFFLSQKHPNSPAESLHLCLSYPSLTKAAGLSYAPPPAASQPPGDAAPLTERTTSSSCSWPTTLL